MTRKSTELNITGAYTWGVHQILYVVSYGSLFHYGNFSNDNFYE